MTLHYFFECLMCDTYINGVMHGAFYFVDYTVNNNKLCPP